MPFESHEEHRDQALEQLFLQAGWSPPPPNAQRIALIEERILHERITKESTDFLFLGVSSILLHIANTAFTPSQTKDEDYKV